MKRRACFVSNSSSSNFVCNDDDDYIDDDDRDLLDTNNDADKLHYLQRKITEVRDLTHEDYEVFDQMYDMLEDLIELIDGTL